MACCVPEGTLPPWTPCCCGSWDVTMIWMHMISDGHKCNRCGRAWNEEYGIEMRPSDLKWAHLPAGNWSCAICGKAWQAVQERPLTAIKPSSDRKPQMTESSPF